MGDGNPARGSARRRGRDRGPRSAAGFHRLGELETSALGLSAARGRELRLRRAWHSVAGGAVAERAPVVGIRRGVLEVRVPDACWAEALTALVPRLAARLASRFPELGVRRFRWLSDGAATPSVKVRPAPDPPPPPRAPASRPPATTITPEALARRYLECAGRPPSGRR